MPRGKLTGNKYLYLPTTGVRTDFKRLMNTFLASNTVRYEHFSEVWREKNMSYLCAGRCTDREAREFIERVMVIAQEYFLPPFQFQVRVGGLYLLYAIYQIQPVVPKVKIRLTRDQWQDTLFFQQQAAQQNHLDVVYVFQRLIQEQAFHFCFTATEMSSYASIKEIQDKEENLADSLKEERSAINNLFSYESLEQLSYLQDQYQQMKINLAGPKASKPDNSLDVVHGEMVEDLIVLMQTFRTKVASISRQGQKTDQQPEKEDVKEDTTGQRRQTLKAQAYSSVTAPSRKTHKVVIDSSSPSAAEETSPVAVQNRTGPTRKLIAASSNAKDQKKQPLLVDHGSSSSDDSDEDYAPPVRKHNQKGPARGGRTATHPPHQKKPGDNTLSQKVSVVSTRKRGHPRQYQDVQEIIAAPPKNNFQGQQTGNRTSSSKYEVIYAPTGQHSQADNSSLDIDVSNVYSVTRRRRSKYLEDVRETATEVMAGKGLEKPTQSHSAHAKLKKDIDEAGISKKKTDSSEASPSIQHTPLKRGQCADSVGAPHVSPNKRVKRTDSAEDLMESKKFIRASTLATTQAKRSISRTAQYTRHTEGSGVSEKNFSKSAETSKSAVASDVVSAQNGNSWSTRAMQSAHVKVIKPTRRISDAAKSQQSAKEETLAERGKVATTLSHNNSSRPVKIIKINQNAGASPLDAIKRLKERCLKAREEETRSESVVSLDSEELRKSGDPSARQGGPGVKQNIRKDDLGSNLPSTKTSFFSQNPTDSNYPSYEGPKKKPRNIDSFRFL